ncbi:hypothetical protein FRB96_004644 [Tulasnella sp. 330]|nr:hypothetical protein FRB96_004644 [Tulasnella sp. 330]KAG8881664.1 hypothetical protein FRB97_009286 [Tulasnella sp. 331]KAG8882738.1 hypothetical protein FRB98_003507 [Tulasnella sp. 332]
MADEFDDELLALVQPEKRDHHGHHRKRTASGSNKTSSNKRRKQEMSDDDSDMEESDADGYPLEGKYKDEEDRERLLSMPEIKREEIFSQRKEELQKDLERKKLEKMVKSQASGGSDATGYNNVSKAAKRKHTTIGSTKEKSRTLEALKQKRQQKESRRATKAHDSESPEPRRRRQRSDTPSSLSESEEGQVPRKGSDNSSLDGVQLKPAPDVLTLMDLNKAQITRDMLENQCFSSQFEEFVKGAWVRLVVGLDAGEMVYRICEVMDVASDLVEPYELNKKLVNKVLELRHGAQVKTFPMNKISCGSFTQREFDRLIRTLEAEKLKPPTKAKLEKKGEMIHNIESRIRTDADMTAMLQRAREVHNKRSAAEMFAMKSSLHTEKMLAVKKHDKAEVARLNVLIEKLEMEMNGRPNQPAASGTLTPDGQSQSQQPAASKPVDALARVNERNRKANLEQMRKAEELTAMRRKQAMLGGKVVEDLSARVKTVVRTKFDSRAGTPNLGGASAAPSPLPANGSVTAVSTPSLANADNKSKIDVLANSVVIDELF